jgi:hypothetical protein
LGRGPEAAAAQQGVHDGVENQMGAHGHAAGGDRRLADPLRRVCEKQFQDRAAEIKVRLMSSFTRRVAANGQ